MAEYIEREKIFSIWRSMPDPASIATLSTAISLTPAADVAPVVHGEWELKHIGAGHYWECSVCHTNPCIYVTKDTQYCPNCGAKMDEEDER